MSGFSRFDRKVGDAEGIDEAGNPVVAPHPVISEGAPGQAPFVPTTSPLGLRTRLDPLRLGALADDAEVDAFVDLSRRLADRSARE